MATVNDIVKLAVDTYNGAPAGQYSLGVNKVHISCSRCVLWDLL